MRLTCVYACVMRVVRCLACIESLQKVTFRISRVVLQHSTILSMSFANRTDDTCPLDTTTWKDVATPLASFLWTHGFWLQVFGLPVVRMIAVACTRMDLQLPFDLTQPKVVAVLLAVVTYGAVTEELLFRGPILAWWLESVAVPFWATSLISSSAFALLHLVNAAWITNRRVLLLHVLNAFLVSVVLNLHAPNLLRTTIMHLVNNWMAVAPSMIRAFWRPTTQTEESTLPNLYKPVRRYSFRMIRQLRRPPLRFLDRVDIASLSMEAQVEIRNELVPRIRRFREIEDARWKAKGETV